MESKRNILITGASGFIGTFLVNEALNRGYNVFAAVRKTSRVEHLNKKNVTLLTFEYTDPISMFSTLANLPKLDYVIHNAGLTKALSNNQFSVINYENTRNLLLALTEPSVKPKKFVFISSIAAKGPNISSINSTGDNPITSYGRSKLLAEDYIRKQHDIPYLIIRPTAVYGPGDRDFLHAIKIINRGFDLQIGSKSRSLSFIYVKDLVRLILDAVESACINKSYLASDGYLYDHRHFGRYVSQALNVKSVGITVPLFVAKIVALCGDLYAAAYRKPTVINSDKIKELSATDWSCNIDDLIADFGFKPEYGLKRGISETVDWYKEKGWL